MIERLLREVKHDYYERITRARRSPAGVEAGSHS